MPESFQGKSKAGSSERCILVFASVHQVMKAEKALKTKGLRPDLVPMPRAVSSDCGVALELPLEVKEEALRFVKEEGLFPEAYYRKRYGQYEKEEPE